MNFDMLGWWEPGVDFDLEIETNHASFWMAEAITNAADLYTGMIYELHIDDGAWWGDHWRFWEQGYCGVNHEESWDWYDPDFNPNYHTANDLLIYLDPDFTVGNVKIAVAGLATLARPYDATGVAGAPPTASVSLTAGPNPFRGRVSLMLTMPLEVTETVLGIYDVQGRLVDRLPMRLTGGRGSAEWTMSGAADRAAGVYFCRPLSMPEAASVRIVHVE
jgi:hypothetical protein